MDPMTQGVRRGYPSLHRRPAALDLVHFGKERKDEVTQRVPWRGFTGTEGVLYAGRAQEKATVWRTQRRIPTADGSSYAWLVKGELAWGRGQLLLFFIASMRTSARSSIKFLHLLSLYTAKLCINGHELAKRQAARAAGSASSR